MKGIKEMKRKKKETSGGEAISEGCYNNSGSIERRGENSECPATIERVTSCRSSPTAPGALAVCIPESEIAREGTSEISSDQCRTKLAVAGEGCKNHPVGFRSKEDGLAV